MINVKNLTAMNHRISSFALLLLFSIFKGIAHSEELHSHEAIEQQVIAFIQEQSSALSEASINVRSISNRLRLPKCELPLEFSKTNQTVNNSGKLTIGVQCQGNQPWTIYVSADITIFDMIVVAKQSISRGSVITLNNVELRKIAIPASRRDYYYDLKDVVGLKSSRSIATDTPIDTSLTEKQVLIKRGQILNILYQIEGIEISMTGKALMDGSKDEVIKVENTTSEKVIDAVVKGKGMVIVR